MSYVPPDIDHFPPWTQGDATDVRGQLYRNTKFDTGLTPAAGMPLIFKNPGYAFGQVQAAGLADGSVTLNKLAANSVDSSKIVNGSIVDADINAAAAILVSKLAAGTNGDHLVTAGGAAAWQAPQADMQVTTLTASLALTTTPTSVGASCTLTPTKTGFYLVVALVAFSVTVAAAGSVCRARIAATAGTCTFTGVNAPQILLDSTALQNRECRTTFAIINNTNAT